MKKRERVFILLSIISIIVTVFLAFCLGGAPMGFYVNPAHFGEGVYVVAGDVLVLKEDVVGVNEDGGELLFEKGQQISVSKYDPEDNSPVVLNIEGDLEFASYTLHGAQYEDITEEFKSEIQAKNKKIQEDGRKLNKEYRRKMALWFMYNGDEIYSATGYHLDTVDGSFEAGFKAAGILFAFEAVFFLVCLLKKKPHIFLVTSLIIFRVLVFLQFFTDISHPTCR